MIATESQIRSFTGVIASRLGLRVDPRTAGQAIDRRATARALTLAAYLVAFDDPAELRVLATELTTGETYFFRQPEQLDALVDVALPARLAARAADRELAILSAGCATGEEAYTIAMLLRDRVPPDWRVVIHGVDLDPRAIAHAIRGRYTRWSLRAVSPAVERRWFVREGEAAVVVPELRGAVSFSEANLTAAVDLWSRRWDIVLCRNVLMYLTEAHADALTARIADALAPGGYLFVGYAEALRPKPSAPGATELDTLCSHGAFYYVRRAPAPIDDAAPAPDAATTRLAHATEFLRSQIAALIREERYDDARAVLVAVPAVTGDRELLLLSAVVHLSRGELDDVEHDCYRVLALQADSAAAHYLIAQCREAGGDVPSATDHARMARALDPGFALAHLQLGRLARRAGDPVTARAELAAALALLEHEDPARVALYGGGFGCGALVGMCRAELDAIEVAGGAGASA
jgi:chemotaxis protein methyltransferase CheR